MNKKHYLDKNNVVTRGVKRGAGWAMLFKSNPIFVWGLRAFFIILFLFLIVRVIF